MNSKDQTVSGQLDRLLKRNDYKDNYKLARYDQAVNALRRCDDVDEVRRIHSKAFAVQIYAIQAKDFELEERARNIRMRAVRRLGEVLKGMKEKGERAAKGSAGGRNKKRTPDDPIFASRNKADPPTLAQMGISSQQSSDSQKLAEIPEAEFDAMLQEPKATTASMIAKASKAGLIASKAGRQGDGKGRQVWGFICSLEPYVESDDPRALIADIDVSMRKDIRRIVPPLVSWLMQLTK